MAARSATKEEADATKVEAFIRRIEGLEAAAFVDSPGRSPATGSTPASRSGS